jgi:hypothetical protein
MKKSSAPIDLLAGFTWSVHRGGYKWLAVQDAGHGQDPGRYVLSSAVDEESEKRNADIYEPSKVPGLFRSFASLTPTRKNILEFANHYGRLGGTIESEEEWTISEIPGLMRRVERFRAWVFEILFMRAMVDLWIAVEAGDERSIARQITWEKRAAQFHYGQGAASVRLPPVPLPESERDPSSPAPWSSELDGTFRCLKIHGWVVHPKRDDPELVEYLQSECTETGLYFLEIILNRKLVEHLIERPRLRFVPHQQLAWQHVPSSLIGMLWLQFADAVAARRNFKHCVQCKRWFEITQKAARTDKLYCSQTCRVRAYRTRQAEVRELHALGSTINDLAERFGSNRKTIETWLSLDVKK